MGRGSQFLAPNWLYTSDLPVPAFQELGFSLEFGGSLSLVHSAKVIEKCDSFYPSSLFSLDNFSSLTCSLQGTLFWCKSFFFVSYYTGDLVSLFSLKYIFSCVFFFKKMCGYCALWIDILV